MLTKKEQSLGRLAALRRVWNQEINFKKIGTSNERVWRARENYFSCLMSQGELKKDDLYFIVWLGKEFNNIKENLKGMFNPYGRGKNPFDRFAVSVK